MTREEPEFLAHYTSFEVLKCLVDGKVMWATDIMYLNDEAEFRYAANIVREELENFGSIRATVESVLNYLVNKTTIAADNTVYVISFSEDEDLLSQWRAYCSADGGINIAFRKNDVELMASSAGFQLVKCVYEEGLQRQLACELLTTCNNLSNYREIEEEFRKGLFAIAPVMKHPSFSEELEWRVVSEPIGFYESRVKYRTSKTNLVPYIEVSIENKDRLLFDHTTIGPNKDANLAWLSTHRLLKREYLEKRLTTDGFVPVFAHRSKTPYRPQ